MKRILVPVILAVLLVMVGAFFSSNSPVTKATATVRADGGGGCSPATVAGTYGFTLTGTLILPSGPVPAAAIGRGTLDASGNLSFTEARNIGGVFANETATGTFSLNADCTGTATFQVFESGNLVRTAEIAVIFDDNSDEFRFVQKSLTLPGGTNLPVVISGEARKISPHSGN